MKIVKRAQLLFLFGLIALSGCQTTPIKSSAIPLGSTDWTIVDPPQLSPMVTFTDPATGKEVTRAWSTLSNAEVLKNLPNTMSAISVAQVNGDGTVKYLAAQTTASVGTYKVVMDYIRYLPETVTDDQNQQQIGMGRVGVSLRLTALVTTTKASVNLGSLMALGVAANLNQLSGSMTVESLGISISGNAGPILTNATIDETGIQKTLESIAVIQSKIADATTTLTPQVLWVRVNTPTVKPAEIKKKLTI